MNADLIAELAALTKQGWACDSAKVSKKLEFRSFEDAFAFMTRCGPEIQRLNPHPEWTNVYNRVDITLTTHDAGGVTVKDSKLARIMDTIVAQFPKKG